MPLSFDGTGSITGIATVSFSDDLAHVGDTNTKIRFPANDTISFETNGAERLRIRSDGKVGIGTDMVGAPASSYGFGFYRATGTGYLYTETGQSGASAGLRAKAGTSDFTIFTTQGVGQLAVYDNTNSAERLRITSTGSVGIGTNNPDVGNTAYPVVQVHGTSTNAYFKLTNTTTGVGSGDGVELSLSGSDAYLTNRESANIIFRTGGSNERLRINSSGYVGVKRSTPLANLHTTNNELALGANPTSAAAPNATYDGLVVDGEAASFINIRSRGNGSDSYGRLAFSDDVRSRAYVEYRHKDGGGDDTMRFATAGGERLRIDSTGKVSLGYPMTTPPSWLHVKGNTYQTLRLENFDGGANGPYIELYNNSASPADNDYTGIISFKNRNSAAEEITYTQIRSQSTDVTDGTEDGVLTFHTRDNGTFGERLRISSAGYVTKPSNPSFHVYNVAGTQNTVLTFSNVHHNNGSHMNAGTGAFTCPVAGRYLFTFAFLHNVNPTSYARVLFELNGSRNTNLGDTLCDDTGLYMNTSMSMIFNLSANDVVKLYNEGNNIYGSQYGAFSGCLLY